MNGHRRSRPARKYSASGCFLPAARGPQHGADYQQQAGEDNDRIEKPQHAPLLLDAGVIRPRVIVLHTRGLSLAGRFWSRGVEVSG